MRYKFKRLNSLGNPIPYKKIMDTFKLDWTLTSDLWIIFLLFILCFGKDWSNACEKVTNEEAEKSYDRKLKPKWRWLM